MIHVSTSRSYPQSNSKLERHHKTLKGDGIRSRTPLSHDDVRRLVAEYLMHYITVRLRNSIDYTTPADRLNSRDKDNFKEWDRKFKTAREQRRIKRQHTYSKIGIREVSYAPLNQTAESPFSNEAK